MRRLLTRGGLSRREYALLAAGVAALAIAAILALTLR
jgi:hypothetical protein